VSTEDDTSPLRILIADDDPLVRSALCKLMGDQPDLRVDGEAADGVEAVKTAVARHPDIVLLDEGIVGLDAMTVIERIREGAPDVQVVVFSAAEDDDVGVAGVRSGAAGYLVKDMSGDALVRALRGLARGEAPVSRSLMLRLVQQLHSDPEPRPAWNSLTTDEWAVLDLLVDGTPEPDVGPALDMRPEEVGAHLAHVLLKLGVSTRAGAIAAARALRARTAVEDEAELDEVTLRRRGRRPSSEA
jgi:DNA-binding NarL/FixJ family response regulator